MAGERNGGGTSFEAMSRMNTASQPAPPPPALRATSPEVGEDSGSALGISDTERAREAIIGAEGKRLTYRQGGQAQNA